MSNVCRYLSERYPWLNLTYLLAAASAIALLLVAIWPHSQLIADLVVLTAIPGILGAILWGMTFWAKARVQIGRRKLSYKSVRRIGGLAALFCLPFLSGWVGIRLGFGSGTSDGRPGPSCQSIVGQPS